MPDDFPFNPDLLIPRDMIRDAIQHWVGSSASHSFPVASLVGPPGSGKSWVIHDLSATPPPLTPPPSVFVISAPELVNKTSSPESPEFLIPAIHKWVNDRYAEVKARYPAAPSYDPLLDDSQAITVLITWLHTLRGSPKTIVLVDGYDEISPDHQDFLADRVLVPLITGGNQVRMVVAHRSPGGLHNDILRNLQKKVFNLEKISPIKDAYDQFAKVRSVNYPLVAVSEPDFREWADLLENYRWNNPYINRFLFEVALISFSDHLRPLTTPDLKICIHALLERPSATIPVATRYPVLTDDPDIILLGRMATLDETFTPGNLEMALGITMLHPLVVQLINTYGVLLAVKGTLRYSLIEPLRSLLLDL